jgi:NADH-quinone oxidoreductase subunit E
MKPTELTRAKVKKIIEKHGNDSAMLIGILQDIQAAARYLPRKNLEQVAQILDIAIAQVYHVATFFRAFSLVPRGEHIVHVCMGTACHVRGSQLILDELERKLDIKAGETTKNYKFTLERVNCVGACAMGPVVKINDDYHGQVKTARLGRILKSYQ